jgi:hypothetical protein
MNPRIVPASSAPRKSHLRNFLANLRSPTSSAPRPGPMSLSQEGREL